MENMDNMEKKMEEIYSTSVRAGKRTYFFDVRENRNGDYYLTITESKKKVEFDGSIKYEKHKIYLYGEDFVNFLNGYNNVIDFLKTHKPEYFEPRTPYRHEGSSEEEYQ